MAASCLVTARGPALLSAQKGRQLSEVRRHAQASSRVNRLVAERRCGAPRCPQLMLWTAPPPARECQRCGRCLRLPRFGGATYASLEWQLRQTLEFATHR